MVPIQLKSATGKYTFHCVNRKGGWWGGGFNLYGQNIIITQNLINTNPYSRGINNFLSFCPSIFLFFYLSTHLSFYLSIFLSFYLSIHLSIYPSSPYLSNYIVFLTFYQSKNLNCIVLSAFISNTCIVYIQPFHRTFSSCLRTEFSKKTSLKYVIAFFKISLYVWGLSSKKRR